MTYQEKIEETIPFTIASKILWNTSNKEVKEFYSKNFKTLKRRV